MTTTATRPPAVDLDATVHVLWVDPATRQAGGSLCLSPADVYSTDVAPTSITTWKQRLAKTLALDPSADVELKLHGLRLGYGAVDAMLPFLRTDAPRFVLSYTPRVLTLAVFVKTISGRTISLHVAPHRSIRHVKVQIEDKEGTPVAMQRLVYRGVELTDSRFVEDYNIPANATLHGLARLAGGSLISSQPKPAPKLPTNGVAFADVSNAAMLDVIHFSSDAPKWRTVNFGLNVEGRCDNSGCVAYFQLVYTPLGFRSFNVVASVASCPMCHEAVVPKSCGFYKCRWRYEGVKVHTDLHLSSGWALAEGDVYHAFKAVDSDLVRWASLVVTAQQLQPPSECAVCFEPLGRSPSLAKLGCKHSIHQACLNEWTAMCRSNHKQATCPLCRSTI
ncbi:Aste57867_24224 [Aphanomyces stellatus]|uniref:Aste57867_24224 protein n=1 Tax=Aphanomyces stellatus TaxID=120398 RepID=A0A485LQL2_9STRA|nr:hypothetical protein As57867_024149 [Aphanomyces stellatus]VFU00865.1 Aste57867_24224 [Aphanomyces stellatus]